MQQFHDTTTQMWKISITVATVKRVRDLIGVDLLEIVDGSLLERLMRDPVLLVDVVYAVIKPQADELDITDEEFGERMFGDPIEFATKALLDELVAFCPSPRDRKNLGRVLEATNQVMDRTRDLIEQKIDTMTSNGELERIAQLAVADEETPPPAGDSSGSVPALSESTQAP